MLPEPAPDSVSSRSLSLRRITKKDWLAILFIFLSLAVVFFDLFTLHKAFLGGDHREQQYPWAKFYQQEIRQGHLPWWTRHMHCGFPILAEGQIGAFYPLNYLFLRFLPIKAAYNYEILFQYLLGALFFYFYLRRKRLSEWGSLFATLIYLYGSAQGGYFYYNLISQKTVIWLPLTLFLIERMEEKESWHDAFWLSLVFTVQVFAGYLQVAVYSVFYSSLYFVYVWWKQKSFKLFNLFVLTGALTFFFSLVQLYPTFELSLFSSRAGAGKELAFVGSMTPVGFTTLFYPSWDGFLGSELYVGCLGLFFLLISFLTRKNKEEKFFFWASLVFLLLALGKFSPLYRGIIELTHFYSFRTPIKFLFFVSFSFAVLSGYGFDKFWDQVQETKGIELARRIFLGLAGTALLVPPLLTGVLGTFRAQLLEALRNYVSTHIYNQAGHPHALDYYMNKAEGFYDGVLTFVSLQHPHTLISWLILAVTIPAAVWIGKKETKRDLFRNFCVVFLFCDLFFYGFTSVKGNYEPFSSIDSPAAGSKILSRLQQDPGPFRTMEIFSEGMDSKKYPVFPNFNMLYGIDDIGAYSPLVMKDYKDLISGWGYANDSISVNWLEPQNVLSHLTELGALNVKYILSQEELSSARLDLILEEKGTYLYENKQVLPRAFFLPGKKTLPPLADIEAVEPGESFYEKQGRVKIHLSAKESGLLVMSDIAYPRWKVRLDGEETSYQRGLGLFKSILVEEGDHEIIFEYVPEFYRKLGFNAALAAFLIFIFISYQKLSRRFLQVSR